MVGNPVYLLLLWLKQYPSWSTFQQQPAYMRDLERNDNDI